jgi:CHAT domain-containing protein
MEHAEFPDDETLAAFIDGGLDEETRRKVVAHVADCGDCYSTVQAARAWEAGDTAASTPPVIPHARFRRVPVLAFSSIAAAAVLAVVFAQPLRDWYDAWSYERATGIGPLVRAAGEVNYRTTEARISGRFAYHRPPDRMRGPETSHPDWRIEAAAGEIRERAASSDRAAAVHGAGVAALADGDLTGAVANLEHALRMETGQELPAAINASHDARLLVDLSAAYYERGRHDRTTADFVRAYETADRAWSLRRLPEAGWNRALAASAMGAVSAEHAWSEYEQVEPDPKWKSEARVRRQSATPSGSVLHPESELRRLALAGASDARLASIILGQVAAARAAAEKAFLASRGRAGDDLIIARRVGDVLCRSNRECTVATSLDAIPMLRSRAAEAVESGFELVHAAGVATAGGNMPVAVHELRNARDRFLAAGVPYGAKIAVDLATRLFEAGSFTAALGELDFVPATASPTLRAQTSWVRGNCELSLGRASNALNEYRAAAESLSEAGDEAGTARVESQIAETLRFVGSVDEAYVHDRRAIGAGSVPSDKRALLFGSAARTARALGCPRAAILLLTEAAVMARSADPIYRLPALLTRLELKADLGDLAGAKDDLREAEGLWQFAQRGPNGDRLAAEMFIARAAVSNPAAAERLLATAARIAAARQDHFRIARSQVAMARALAAGSRTAESAAVLTTALAEIDEVRGRLSSADQRMSFVDSWRAARDELVWLLVRNGKAAEALIATDLGRSRLLLERRGGRQAIDVGALSRAIPRGSALVEYALVQGHAVAWKVERGGIVCVSLGVSATALRDEVNRFTQDLQLGRDVEREAASLYDALVRPLNVAPFARIVIVPDGFLFALPYAALGDHRDYLVKTHEISIAPSASTFIDYTARPNLADAAALMVVNPLRRGEPDLPGARRETADAGSTLVRVQVLSGGDATPQRVLHSAAVFPLLHVAVHAAPDGSALLLTPDAQKPDGKLTSADIFEADLGRSSLVTLAACGTSAGPVSASEGALSLARAFLGAGAGCVVASLWPVGDDDSSALFSSFYRAIRGGASPASALRHAQLSMLRNPAASHPRSWAAYSTFGH